METFSQNDDDNYKTNAKKCYELSIKLNPFIPSYGALASVYGLEDNIDKAIEYCNKGVEALEKLKKSPKEQLSYYNQALLLDTSTLDFLKELKNGLLGKR